MFIAFKVINKIGIKIGQDLDPILKNMYETRKKPISLSVQNNYMYA